MYQRDLGNKLLQDAAQYPVVTVTGPRQSGKTTLVRQVFPDHQYCNLENPELRTLATRDPKQFFSMFEGPVILDEVQRVPELLSWVQVRVDERKQKGEVILTGSHQFRLHEAISQSLAGRTAVHRLLPLSLAEWSRSHEDPWPKKGWFLHQGLMPGVHQEGLNPVDAYRNYFQTYVERDVRLVTEIRHLDLFERFLKLLAGRVGQLINLHAMSGEVGTSSTTLAKWLSILEASYIVFRLPPYYRNFGKRLVKTPKLYFVEPGLAAWLLGIESAAQAERDPLHGALFENLVVTELLKARYNRGRESNLSFWRDTTGHEVDVLVERNRRPLPVEIKSAMTWHPDMFQGVKHFQKRIDEALPGAVVYAGDLTAGSEQTRVLHYKDSHRLIGDDG